MRAARSSCAPSHGEARFQASEVGADRTSGMSGSPKGRILVADDEPLTLRVYARMLHHAGYAVETAESGQKALQAFEAGPFDVIVSDLAMPDLDGLSTLRAIHERDEDMPVLLMTSGPTLESAIRAVEYRAVRYLTKPLGSEELLDAVEIAMAHRRQAALKRQAEALAAERARAEVEQQELGAAFDRVLDGLWVAMQPIVRWSTRTVFGYEALLRSPEPTLPHPGAVLAAAERLGRLHALGRVVRRRVAEAVVALPRETQVFVNLHPHDLGDPDVIDPLSPLSLEAPRVTLEITERCALRDLATARTQIDALRALGYRVAIDDLGEGYAALNSVSSLEPEVAKIDMSLVRDLHRSPNKRAVVRSIVTLCQDLGVTTIAEGVECAAERDALAELGVDLFQGYLFAKPGRPFPVPEF
jgi:EAL domain-containing protein (putative c-di-GMP-specific phosphodiesterase class I)